MIPRERTKAMLKVSIRAGGLDVVEASGSLAEILTDLLVTIKAIHRQLSNMDPVTAMAFKEALKAGIAADDGPVWGGPPLQFVGMGFSGPVPGRAAENEC